MTLRKNYWKDLDLAFYLIAKGLSRIYDIGYDLNLRYLTTESGQLPDGSYGSRSVEVSELAIYPEPKSPRSRYPLKPFTIKAYGTEALLLTVTDGNENDLINNCTIDSSDELLRFCYVLFYAVTGCYPGHLAGSYCSDLTYYIKSGYGYYNLEYENYDSKEEREKAEAAERKEHSYSVPGVNGLYDFESMPIRVDPR